MPESTKAREHEAIAPEQSSEEENPIRARNRLADAIGEILRNEFAPPALRSAVVGYVCDEPPRQPPPPPRPADSDDDDAASDGPTVGERYRVAMEKLGLDMATIDQIADAYLDTGDDSHLRITIGLLMRLLNLERGAQGSRATWRPETLENYLPLLIGRLYRATDHCAEVADSFALEAEEQLPRSQKLEKGSAD